MATHRKTTKASQLVLFGVHFKITRSPFQTVRKLRPVVAQPPTRRTGIDEKPKVPFASRWASDLTIFQLGKAQKVGLVTQKEIKRT